MAVTDFSVSNTAFFKITSAGAAYTLTMPFDPDQIEWWNYTKFGTNTNNLSGVWVRGMPAGDDLIVTRGTTTLTSTLETTNGVTILPDGSGFADQHKTPTAITAATQCTVTINAHGWTNGQWVRASNFVTSPTADATGMQQLNYRQFVIGNVTANTFVLYDPQTNIAVDSSAYTAFVNNGFAKFTRIGQELNTQNPSPVFRATLGTAIMGAASDVIYVKASQGNQYTDLGQVS